LHFRYLTPFSRARTSGIQPEKQAVTKHWSSIHQQQHVTRDGMFVGSCPCGAVQAVAEIDHFRSCPLLIVWFVEDAGQSVLCQQIEQRCGPSRSVWRRLRLRRHAAQRLRYLLRTHFGVAMLADVTGTDPLHRKDQCDTGDNHRILRTPLAVIVVCCGGRDQCARRGRMTTLLASDLQEHALRNLKKPVLLDQRRASA
jgi:hypothetical protein